MKRRFFGDFDQFTFGTTVTLGKLKQFVMFSS
jgi:hypothetical protein